MGCPACTTDYDQLEKRIDNGEISAEEQLHRALEQEGLFVRDGLVIYCPDCRSTIQRLKARIAARLRRETLSGIPDLLDRAYEKRKLEKDRETS